MERILITIDALQVNRNTLDFACYIARLMHSKLTGIFLENLVLEEVSVAEEQDAGEVCSCTLGSPGAHQKARLIGEQIHLFKEFCSRQGVQGEVKIDRNIPSAAIIAESRFADLIILDATASFDKHQESVPTGFARDVLSNAECPVLIAPDGFDGIDEIILAYDGSASSLFAIKQFNYLFPELCDKRVIAIQVNDSVEMPLAEREKVGEWLKVHYSRIGFQVREGQPDEELFSYLLNRKKSLVVMGAFGRNMLSALLKCSTAEVIMKVVNLPIFVTHY